MNKLEFVNEIGILANKFAFLFQNYTASHKGYTGKTDDNKPIIIGQISASIQNDELATIEVSIGSADSKHELRINRCPNSNFSDWSVEDK